MILLIRTSNTMILIIRTSNTMILLVRTSNTTILMIGALGTFQKATLFFGKQPYRGSFLKGCPALAICGAAERGWTHPAAAALTSEGALLRVPGIRQAGFLGRQNRAKIEGSIGPYIYIHIDIYVYIYICMRAYWALRR